MKTYPMTVNGAKQLENELVRLKTIERPNVIQAISEARSHGDLSENAEYDAAKEKQGFIEGRIAEIESKLSLANIIDPSSIENNGRIIFGLKVELFDLETEKSVCYQIVGDDEADLSIGKISVNSPVAKSLIGKEIGQVVEIKVPNGIKEYEILDTYL
ncbi:MAG: transcription elongation factor GreA [Burkholderiales bacterium]|jgi:transcription elongation factor GreA|nr:transcription elongation factor GreA [Burkholderiales bacterium]